MALVRWVLVALNAVSISVEILKEEIDDFFLAAIEVIIDLRLKRYLATHSLLTNSDAHERIRLILWLRKLNLSQSYTCRIFMPNDPTTTVIVSRRIFSYQLTKSVDSSLTRRTYEISMLRPGEYIYAQTQTGIPEPEDSRIVSVMYETGPRLRSGRGDLATVDEIFRLNDLLATLGLPVK